MEQDGERAPLLSEQHDVHSGVNPPAAQPGWGLPSEPPPPYSSTGSCGVAPLITCRVCQSTVPVEGKLNQFVVKCSRCNEATPIRNAPEGKKYVRCFCNCLLICKVTSQKISCPRSQCKRVIDLKLLHCDEQLEQQPEQQQQPFRAQVVCGHCQHTFLWPETKQPLARCPHCRKISSCSNWYPRRRSLWCFLLFVVLVPSTVGLLVGTWKLAQHRKGIYVAWLLLMALTLAVLSRSIYWRCLKISRTVSRRS